MYKIKYVKNIWKQNMKNYKSPRIEIKKKISHCGRHIDAQIAPIVQPLKEKEVGWVGLLRLLCTDIGTWMKTFIASLKQTL